MIIIMRVSDVKESLYLFDESNSRFFCKSIAHLEMYEGTTAVKAAASNPADDLLVTSIVSQ